MHFLYCEEFACNRARLGMIEGFEDWMAEWRNKGDEDRLDLLLGRSVAGI